MTVRDLIARLAVLDPDAVVILQSDSEGNGYSPAVGAEPGIYRADTTWSGSTFPGSVATDAKIRQEYEYEPDKGDVPCVILWPVS